MTDNNPLSQVITEYVTRTGMRQIDLAEYLNVSERTVRRWKNGEDTLTDIRELKRIADLLDVKPEKLGIASSPIPFTSDQLEPTIDHIWKLVRLARYRDANVLVDKLIYNVSTLIKSDDRTLLTNLAATQHIAGFVKSQITRSNQTAIPLTHYKEMERIAHVLEDNELLVIALTYSGDMLQRGGNVLEAITYLEEAKTIPSSVSSKGNAMQLLGRAYFKAKKLGDFERAMKESEELAFDPVIINPTSSVKGQFNVATVYEEYRRSLGLLGQLNQGIDYLQKAEKLFNQDWNVQRRSALVTSAKAMILVHSGEIREGVQVAIEATKLCRLSGNIRLLDRIYGIQKYLDHLNMEIGKSGYMLREVLDGPVEY